MLCWGCTVLDCQLRKQGRHVVDVDPPRSNEQEMVMEHSRSNSVQVVHDHAWNIFTLYAILLQAAVIILFMSRYHLRLTHPLPLHT